MLRLRACVCVRPWEEVEATKQQQAAADQRLVSPTPARKDALRSSVGFKRGRGASPQNHDPSGS
jgi:hypothetical protein